MSSNSNSTSKPKTKAVEGEPDGKNDLRCIFSSDGKRLLIDNRRKS